MAEPSKSERKRISAPSHRGLLVFIGPLVFLTVTLIVIGYFFVLPAPPDTIYMSTGNEGGAYAFFGERYKKILAREKVQLEPLFSSGSVENLKRLADRSSRVDAGFVQDGTGSTAEARNLVSLGAICYSPLWVFYRGEGKFDDPSKLKGMRIAAGPPGSGVRKFAMDLLKACDVDKPPTQIFDFPAAEANKALLQGKVDVVMIAGTDDNTLVRELLYAEGVKLMNFKHAEAYTRIIPALSHVILPEGILNLSRDMPSEDIHLLAPTTNLLVRKELHPALIFLLLDAAVEIHSRAGWVNKRGEFPAPKEMDFPSSKYAERFYKSGRPFLLDYLPFWVAIFADRLVLILLPIAVVLIPLIRAIPWFYSWRNRRKIYQVYSELKNLEADIMEQPDPEKMIVYQERLGWIETAINNIHVPLAFFPEVYKLKEHVNLVQSKVTQLDRRAASRQP
jgi:TRAP-type uncharacterized transport system substrate-binding protein